MNIEKLIDSALYHKHYNVMDYLISKCTNLEKIKQLIFQSVYFKDSNLIKCLLKSKFNIKKISEEMNLFDKEFIMRHL